MKWGEGRGEAVHFRHYSMLQGSAFQAEESMLRKQESLTSDATHGIFITAVSLSGLHPPFAQRLLRRSLAHFQIPADQSRGELKCMFCQCMSTYPDSLLSPSLLTGTSLRSCSLLHIRKDRRTGRN